MSHFQKNMLQSCPIPLFRGFASFGDLLLVAGTFCCLMAVMRPHRMPRRVQSG